MATAQKMPKMVNGVNPVIRPPGEKLQRKSSYPSKLHDKFTLDTPCRTRQIVLTVHKIDLTRPLALSIVIYCAVMSPA